MKDKRRNLTVKEEFNRALNIRNDKVLRTNNLIEKTRTLISEFEYFFEMKGKFTQNYNHIMFHDDVVSLHVAGCIPIDMRIIMDSLGLQEKRSMGCFAHYGNDYPDTLWLELKE